MGLLITLYLALGLYFWARMLSAPRNRHRHFTPAVIVLTLISGLLFWPVILLIKYWKTN